MHALLLADVHFAEAVFCVPAAGTISGEEFPIVSKTNIKEYRDSLSCETFSFPANPNITFHVYVSNFSWPIKIQVRSAVSCTLNFVQSKTAFSYLSSTRV